MNKDKILLITYYWPPAGGPGVQRWYKLTKYLINQGFEVDVVTVAPEKANYPILDHSLEEGFDKEKVRVFRTDNFDIFMTLKRFSKRAEYPISGFANSTGKLSFKAKLIRKIRSKFFLPDPRKFWNKYALKQCRTLISENNYQSIITTSPPHSTQLIGLELKKEFPNIHWISDLRDPWTDIYYYDSFLHSEATKKKDLNLEKQVILASDKILVIGDEMKAMYAKKYNKEIEDKTYVIPNGYDATDITSKETPKQEFFNIVYTGTIANNYPIQDFITALEKIKSTLDKPIKLTFVGRVDNQSKKLLLDSTLKESTAFIGHVSHQEAIDYMHQANLLLLIIPNHEHNKLHMSGKIFEYIASHRPVLSLGPIEGDAANVLRKTNSGKTFNYNAMDDIETYIKEQIKYWDENPLNYKISNNPEQYTRENITSTLVKTLTL